MIAALDLALTGIAAVLWYLWPALGPWPLLLIVAGRLARTKALGRRGWRRTRFDLPLLLFGATAVFGAWLAYDPTAGWSKLWVIIGGLALYDSLARGPEEVRIAGRTVSPQRLLFALLPAVIALYFLLTTDWSRWMGKLPWLDPIMAWLAAWQPALPGHRLHPNVAGGLIAVLIPLQVAAVRGWRVAWPLVGLAAAGLLLTGSRGAWLALGLAAATWAAWQGWIRRWPRFVRWAGAALLVVLGCATVAIVLALGPTLFPGGRPDLWRNSIDLALDTPFTGLGLAGFQMAYSSYVLLLHVGHTVHSHNLLLDLWLEQGVVGLGAFVWLVVSGVRGQGAGRPQGGGQAGAAALMALAVILGHGLVDDAFYGSRAVLLLFVPFALLARAEGELGREEPGSRGAWIAASALAMTVLLALLPQTRAAFQANLGAVTQTRAELGAYEWPRWPIQDALRRQAPGSPSPVDLAPAIARYEAALALDPANVTADRRLGQIELSRGEDAAARRHLAAAYAAAPDQRATRQLLGESYAIAGDAARAIALWSTIDLSQGQLALRRWWYEHVGDPQSAGKIGM